MMRHQFESFRVRRASFGQVAESRQSSGAFREQIGAFGIGFRDDEFFVQNRDAFIELVRIEQMTQTNQRRS